MKYFLHLSGSGSVAESIPLTVPEQASLLKVKEVQKPSVSGGIFSYFLLLLAKSGPSETRSLRKAPLLTKSMPPELKACRSSWKLRPLPAAHCGRTDFRYIVFYRRTKSCFDQTVDPCSCGVSWLLRRAWDSSSPMLLSSFRLFCMIELRVVFKHFAGEGPQFSFHCIQSLHFLPVSV